MHTQRLCYAQFSMFIIFLCLVYLCVCVYLVATLLQLLPDARSLALNRQWNVFVCVPSPIPHASKKKSLSEYFFSLYSLKFEHILRMFAIKMSNDRGICIRLNLPQFFDCFVVVVVFVAVYAAGI